MLEHEFILNYARTEPIPMDIGIGLDWHYILRQAKAHNVAPLLYNNIRALPVPTPILKEFERIYTYTAFHNMLYLEELQKILERINAIVLKGPMLAQDVYGNIALRPFVDMDILIKKKEMDNIKKILYDLGYSTMDEAFYKKYHFHMPFIKMGKIPIHIELHWEFVDKFILHKIDMDRVWGEAKGSKLPTEINILYLLLHIEKHAFFNKAIYNHGNPRDWLFENPCGNQLIWYTDIYESIVKNTPSPPTLPCGERACGARVRGKINWQVLLGLAEEWRIQNIVYNNFYILNKLYPIPFLEGLPQPRFGLPKRLIYNIALKKAEFRVHPEMQLRPIRAIDLINYLFPPPKIIKNYYFTKNCIPIIIYYIIHISIAIKNILDEFLGICIQKTRRCL